VTFAKVTLHRILLLYTYNPTLMESRTLTLARKEEICDNTWEFSFEKPENFDFIAGQYMIWDIPEGKHKDDRPSFRSLSMGSAPCEEFLKTTMRASESAFKKNIVALEPGDTVSVKGPVGHFVLPEDETIPVTFVVGGVGITPARSMLVQSVCDKSERPLKLFYSNLNPNTAPYWEEMENLDLKNYACVNTMSHMDDAPELAWEKETGFICADMLTRHEAVDPRMKYYVVGTKGFIEAMKGVIEECGISKDKVVVDNFG